MDGTGKPKDLWDKLQASSAIVAAILLPLVLIYINQTYDARQKAREDLRHQEATRINELETLEKFTPHLASADSRSNEVAILAICALGNQELATQLARLIGSRGTAAALDHIHASGTACAPRKEAASPKPVTTLPPNVKSLQAESGWAFLGTYVEARKAWETRYFQFGENAEPQSLVNRDLAASISVNLREGMPNPDGTFPRVADVIKPGSRVKILEIRPWQATGFMWARVSYVPRQD